MTIFLGLDGGGSGCRAVAQMNDGPRTAIFKGGPANIFSGTDTALGNIRNAAYQAVAATAPDQDFTELGRQVVAVLGLAGAVETNAAHQIEKALPFASVTVVGDVEAALKGAFQSTDGVMSAIGTGTVHAVQRNQIMRRAGGYGFLIGDEGSGAWMGRALLSRALHAKDGLIPASDLTREIWAEMADVAGILKYARDASPAELAAFAPRIISAFEAQDSTSSLILSEATQWIDRSIETLQDSASGQLELPVAFTGGLGNFFEQQLAHRWPITQPFGSALDGALWMARQQASQQNN
jgi:glucosamine kinase